jgi:hypothetical protein
VEELAVEEYGLRFLGSAVVPIRKDSEYLSSLPQDGIIRRSNESKSKTDIIFFMISLD